MGDPAIVALTSSLSSRGAPLHMKWELNSGFSNSVPAEPGKTKQIVNVNYWGDLVGKNGVSFRKVANIDVN